MNLENIPTLPASASPEQIDRYLDILNTIANAVLMEQQIKDKKLKGQYPAL